MGKQGRRLVWGSIPGCCKTSSEWADPRNLVPRLQARESHRFSGAPGKVDCYKRHFYKTLSKCQCSKNNWKQIPTWSPRPHSTLHDVHSAQLAQLPGTAKDVIIIVVILIIFVCCVSHYFFLHILSLFLRLISHFLSQFLHLPISFVCIVTLIVIRDQSCQRLTCNSEDDNNDDDGDDDDDDINDIG